ncbi:hypothetical protein XELAEV_18002039mg [Xenopus laevis]|uniref:Uncharacterized protein n=1 Tax=Xenopus laevis TaxID=8355 RepID=A0A974BP79_XENLA|nr:hypothetical protein XELAEV_18002039mg [Xenopus laevis]
MRLFRCARHAARPPCGAPAMRLFQCGRHLSEGRVLGRGARPPSFLRASHAEASSGSADVIGGHLARLLHAPLESEPVYCLCVRDCGWFLTVLTVSFYLQYFLNALS